MFVLILFVSLILCQAKEKEDESSGDSDFGGQLVSSLRNDANLDLPVDEEYEDLRAELLAYHTALASLTGSTNTRRSLLTTPCWELGGICVEYPLCRGFRFLTEVPGCKNRFNVCCFTWNKYKISDFRHEGISNLDMPWGTQQQFGGLGVKDMPKIAGKKRKQRRKQKKLALFVPGVLDTNVIYSKPGRTEPEESKKSVAGDHSTVLLVLPNK